MWIVNACNVCHRVRFGRVVKQLLDIRLDLAVFCDRSARRGKQRDECVVRLRLSALTPTCELWMKMVFKSKITIKYVEADCMTSKYCGMKPKWLGNRKATRATYRYHISEISTGSWRECAVSRVKRISILRKLRMRMWRKWGARSAGTRKMKHTATAIFIWPSEMTATVRQTLNIYILKPKYCELRESELKSSIEMILTFFSSWKFVIQITTLTVPKTCDPDCHLIPQFGSAICVCAKLWKTNHVPLRLRLRYKWWQCDSREKVICTREERKIKKKEKRKKMDLVCHKSIARWPTRKRSEI